MLRTKSAIFAAVALVLAACGDNPSGSGFPSLRGNYTAAWTFLFDAGSLGSFSSTCTGTLNISQQSGGEFSGTFLIQGPVEDCDVGGGSIQGQVTPGGAIEFDIDAPGDDDLEELTQCDVVAADDRFTGTFNNGVISASTDALLDCETDFGVLRVALELQLVASRL